MTWIAGLLIVACVLAVVLAVGAWVLFDAFERGQ